MASRGRPQKPYAASWGEHVTGLARDKDGRWRIVATGDRYTEADERIAVKRFREWEAKQRKHAAVHMVTPHDPAVPATAIVPIAIIDGVPTTDLEMADLWKLFDSVSLERWDGSVGLSEVGISYPLPGTPFWSWLGKLIAKHPAMVAKYTGIPELAGLAHMALPQDALRIAELITVYQKQGSARLARTKKVVVGNLNRLVAHAGAVTLADLTVEKLNAFRASVESDPDLKAASTVKKIYRDIRTVIAFGLKVGMDAIQIRAALDRCKVLWTSKQENGPDPHPISRNNLNRLLKAAKKTKDQHHWTAKILLGLNCGLKFKDVLDMEWSTIDMESRTYCSIRSKTRANRIPQAAYLWKETIAALKALPRNGSKYVFTSKHGIKYTSNSPRDAFTAFRTRATAKREDGTWVTFDDFRDGAYTTACRMCDSDKFARLLCGHKAHGFQDNYVLRNPQIVKPATDAVYKNYFG